MAETRDELSVEEHDREYEDVVVSEAWPATARTMAQTVDMNDVDDPEVIRASISQTRAQMSETVDTIQARLSPENLKQQAQEAIREATVGKVKDMASNVEHTVKSWRSNVVSTIKQNPVPAAMVALGLGWLLMSEDSNQYPDYSRSRYAGNYPSGSYASGSYGSESSFGSRGMSNYGREQTGLREGVRETVEGVRETVNEVKSNIQETAGEVREQVQHVKEQAQHRVDEFSEQAQYQAHRAKQGFQHMMAENPLAVGAAALAIGATIGLLIPATQRENELMGQARDRLVEKAQTTAKQTMETVGEAVKEDIREMSEATKSAKPAQRQTPPPHADHASGDGEGRRSSQWPSSD